MNNYKIFYGYDNLLLWDVNNEYWFGSYSRHLINSKEPYNDKDRIIVSTGYQSGSDDISDYLKVSSPFTLFNIEFTVDLLLIDRFWEYILWDFTGNGLKHLKEKKLEFSFKYAPDRIQRMYHPREFLLKAYHPLRYIRFIMRGYNKNEEIEEYLSNRDFWIDYYHKQFHLFDKEHPNFNKKGYKTIIIPIKEYMSKHYREGYKILFHD